MSGPKVVRVVTREERVAACEVLLARRDAAFSRWEAQVAAMNLVGIEVDHSAHGAKRAALQVLLESDRFDDLVLATTAEIALLAQESDRMRVAMAQAHAAGLQRSRVQRENARALSKDLAIKGVHQGGDLPQRLQRVAEGEISGPEGDAVLGAATRLLATAAPAIELTQAQRSIAASLKEADAGSGPAAVRLPPASNGRLTNLERHLGELGSWGASVDAFAARLRMLEVLPDDARTQLLIDGLVLEVAAATRAAYDHQAKHAHAEELLRNLHSIGPGEGVQEAAARLSQVLRNAMDGVDADAFEAALNDAQKVVNQVHSERAAIARRGAVLQGLAALGYEVREGMATAWAKAGRVVLRKPSLPDYGIELASAADADRLQVRAVALEASRDAARDADVEALWCGDFKKLQRALADSGGAIHIERALAVGAVPLKLAGPSAVTDDAKTVERGSRSG